MNNFDEWLSQQTEKIDVECGCVMTEVLFHCMRKAFEARDDEIAALRAQANPEYVKALIEENEKLKATSAARLKTLNFYFGKYKELRDEYWYEVERYRYKGPAKLCAGADGPAWFSEGSDLLVANDEVKVIRKIAAPTRTIAGGQDE